MIRADFMRANVHMFARTELDGIERLCALVISQGEKLALLAESTRRCEARVGGFEEGLERGSQRRRLMDAPSSVAEDANMAMGARLWR